MTTQNDDGTIQADEAGLYTFPLLGRATVRLKRLSGDEARRSDILSEKLQVRYQTRALCAVREVVTVAGKTEKFDFPQSADDLDAVASLLDANEYDLLALFFVKYFVLNMEQE